MTINIEYEAEEKLDLDYEKIITDVVNEAVDYEKCPYEAEVNVTIVDSESIHEIIRNTEILILRQMYFHFRELIMLHLRILMQLRTS